MSFLSSFKNYLSQRRLRNRLPADVFTEYARRNKWGDSESLSGKGSNLEATEKIRSLLPQLFNELNVKTLLDVPCGDFNWMQHVDFKALDYLGGDIVPSLIESNNAKYANLNVKFQVIDLIKGPVPRADIVFVRDCLVHLSNAHATAAIENIIASKSTWLLTTTFPNTESNLDIVTGQWRAVDLNKSPFSFPAPFRLIPEGQAHLKGQTDDKMLGLWRISDIENLSA